MNHHDDLDVGLGAMYVPVEAFAAEVASVRFGPDRDEEPSAIDVFRLTLAYAEIMALKVTRDCPGCEL